MPLSPFFDLLEHQNTLRWTGRVLQIAGNLIQSEGPFCSVGDSCEVERRDGRRYQGEIVGFRGSTMLSMMLEQPHGIRYGDQVIARGGRPSVRVGREMLGRVVDATGAPIDERAEFRVEATIPIDGAGP